MGISITFRSIIAHGNSDNTTYAMYIMQTLKFFEYLWRYVIFCKDI